MIAGPTDTRLELSRFDGKNITVLSELLADKTKRGLLDEFLDELSEFAGDEDPKIKDGATWILYQHLKSGGSISTGQQSILVKNAAKTNSWAAQLHICQLVSYLTLSKKEAEKLALFVTPLLAHQRPFLRAWSLNAICQLAKQHPRFVPAAKKALARAAQDKAASVRARARKISL